MDKWTEDNIKRMTIGGNDNMMAFFKAHEDWRDGMSINEKYNSTFAALYKDKVRSAKILDMRPERDHALLGKRSSFIGCSNP
jgi:hypothetical protein